MPGVVLQADGLYREKCVITRVELEGPAMLVKGPKAPQQEINTKHGTIYGIILAGQFGNDNKLVIWTMQMK